MPTTPGVDFIVFLGSVHLPHGAGEIVLVVRMHPSMVFFHPLQMLIKVLVLDMYISDMLAHGLKTWIVPGEG